MISREKAIERKEFIESFGEKAASIHYNVKISTLERQMRWLASETKVSNIKVLVLDIETAPAAAFVWQFWKANVGKNQVISDWFMLSWSAKWLNDSNIMNDVLTSEEALKQDDSRISMSIHTLVDEADIVIAHNGKKFDMPKLNTRFLINGLPKPSPYQIIDTLLVARKEFGFNSNALDSLCRQLGLDTKVETGGFELWRACYNGDEEGLTTMSMYNDNDVVILEELYHVIKAWIPNHPRMFSDTDGETCEVCGEKHLVSNGFYRTTVNKYESFSCMSCGASLRMRVNNEKNNELVVCAR